MLASVRRLTRDTFRIIHEIHRASRSGKAKDEPELLENKLEKNAEN
jgi:hypothetical protein